jgi:MoxR-like ATPase
MVATALAYSEIGSVEMRKVMRMLVKNGNITGITGVQIADSPKQALVDLCIAQGLESDTLVSTLKAVKEQPEAPKPEPKPEPKQEEEPKPNPIPEPKPEPKPEPAAKATAAHQEVPKLNASMELKATSDLGLGALATLLAPHLKLEAHLDEAKVAEMIQTAINQQDPKVLEVRVPGIDAKRVKRPHKCFDSLVKLMAIRQHVFMVGPAGTGKSHAAEQAAQALGLSFYALSCGPQTTQAALLGYQSATGTYVSTLFRQAYEQGGVFLLDEVDSASGAVLVVLNSATSNGYCAFPDGMVRRHKDFILVCAGNTWGHGKTVEYVGRQALDGAFLDRMATLAWPVDTKLELELSPVKEWCRYIQKVREVVAKAGIKMIVSPRASISGGNAILAGFTPEEARDMYVLKGADPKVAEIVNAVVLPVVVTEQAKEAEVA